MILQTKPATLLALMAVDSRKFPRSKTHYVDILGFWIGALDPPEAISNDRTTLKHEK